MAEYGKIVGINSVPLDQRNNKVLYNVPGYSYGVPEKVNFWNDDLDTVQEKLSLDYKPYVEEPTTEAGKAAQYGFASAVSGAAYHVSALPGWTDRIADNTLRLFGANPDQWKFSYTNGSNISNEAQVTNFQEEIALREKFKEKKKFKQSLDDNTFKRFAFNTLASIDSSEDYLKDVAESLGPEHMFGLDAGYAPDTIAEQVIAGFAGAPIMIAEYAGATVAATAALSLAGISAPVTASAIAFGTVGFLGAYEKPWQQVASDTAMGALEGAAFGSVNKLSGWATRSIALGAIGAASAKMHGGGTTEIVSGAITLAGLGFAGPMVGLKRPGEGAFSAPEKAFTVTPAYTVLLHDSVRLAEHGKPIKSFIETEGKGYHVESEALPFKLEKESHAELTKKSKADTAVKDFGNVDKLTPTKATIKAIETGQEIIPFKRVKKETKKEELDYSKGEKEVLETVKIPRDQVIFDGKYLDMTIHMNARTKNFVPVRKTEVKPETKKGTFEDLTATLEARTSNTRIAAENVSIAKDVASTYGFKFLRDGAKVELKLSQLQALAKSKKKGDAWAKSALVKALEINNKRSTSITSRLKRYDKTIDVTIARMGRLASASIGHRPDPGESPFMHFKDLENSILDGRGNRKLDKDGKPNEVDLTGDIGGFTGGVLNMAQKFGLPAKLAGDPSKNAFLRFITTKVKNFENAVNMGKDDILYKKLIDPKYTPDKIKFVEENPGMTQAGIAYKFGNILGTIKTYKSKEGAWTRFELLLRDKGKRGGIESANKMINAMVRRELAMQKRAELATGGKKSNKAKIEKELQKRNADGTYKYQMKYNEMRALYKLTAEEISIVKGLDKGLAEARIYHNKAAKQNPEVEATIIPERPNYFPRSWVGRHKLYIKSPGKDGELVHAIAGKSEKEVFGVWKTLQKTNPEFKKYTVNYHVESNIQISGKNASAQRAFDEAIKIWDKKDPLISSKLNEARIEWTRKQGFGSRKVSRKDIGGYAGTGKTGRRNLEDFQESYLGYIDGAIRNAEMIRFRGQVELPMSRTVLKDQIPQQYAMGAKYIDNAFGRNAGYLAKKGDELIEFVSNAGVFKKFASPNTFQKGIQFANSLTLHKALLFFNPRFLYSQIVQPYQMGLQRLQFMKVEYGIKGDIGKAVVEGSYLPFKPTPEFRQLVVDAIKTGTIDTKFLKEFGIDARTGKRIKTKLEDSVFSFDSKLAERATGKRLSEIAERHSRLTALAMNYSFLKSGKYDIANGKETMFKTAKWMTDNMMVEYNFTNRPLMYTHQGLGTIGSLFGLFKTFQHNYYGQVAQYARTWAKNPKSFDAASPLLMHATSMVMTAGLFGILGVNQIDGLIRFMNGTIQTGLKTAGVDNPSDYRIPEYTEAILALDLPMEQKFGLPSALVNADVSSTLAAPGLGPGDLVSLPTLDFLFGMTSKTNDGVIGNAFNILSKSATGMYTDADMYKFLKSTMPPILLADVERRFANVSKERLFSALPFGLDKKFGEGPVVSKRIGEAKGRYMEWQNNRYVVTNPYKGMRGAIERDIGGFWARYLGGRSFEESLLLKTIWQSSKISKNHTDKVNALVTAAASDGYDGLYDNILFYTDAAIDLGYTQEQFLDKVTNRMESMSNTILSRVKGFAKTHNMTRDDFIMSVLHNNNINLAYPVGSK